MVPQAPGQPTQVVQDPLRGALRQALRPRTQGGNRVPAWPIRPPGHPDGPGRPGPLATDGADQLRPWVCGDHRHAGGHLVHLLPRGLGIVSRQRLRATATLRRLERNHHVDFFYRHHCPRLPLGAGLPARAPSTRLAAWPLTLRRLTRRRMRGGARVLGQPLHQILDGCIESRHTCCKCQHLLLGFVRCASPNRGRSRCMRCHRAIIRHQQRG
jgi:hypothetical protein